MALSKATGLPLAEGLEYTTDFPHTISYAILYRTRINSYAELPNDKQPPKDLWDKPWRLEQFFDEAFKRNDGGGKGKTYIEYEPEDVE